MANFPENMSATVTALIAVYNGEKYIDRAIQSVLAQHRPADELIVVDDGSTDGTAEAIQQYGSSLRYVRQDNKGVSVARNVGIRLAKSSWVAFLDHDDQWLPNKLDRQMAILEATPSASVCYSGYWFHGLTGAPIRKHWPLNRQWPDSRIRNPFPPSVAVVRRSALLALGGFREDLRGCEDWDLFVRLLRGYGVVSDPEPLTDYFELATSASLKYQIMMQDTLKIVEDTLLDGLSGLERTYWRRRIVSAVYYQAALAARQARGRTIPLLFKSLHQWPTPDKRLKTLVLELGRSVRAI